MSPRSCQVRNLAGTDADVVRRLATSLADVRTLGDLMDWGRTRVPKASLEDIITQDEFTHDVLVPIEPPLWLAFDVT